MFAQALPENTFEDAVPSYKFPLCCPSPVSWLFTTWSKEAEEEKAVRGSWKTHCLEVQDMFVWHKLRAFWTSWAVGCVCALVFLILDVFSNLKDSMNHCITFCFPTNSQNKLNCDMANTKLVAEHCSLENTMKFLLWRTNLSIKLSSVRTWHPQGADSDRKWGEKGKRYNLGQRQFFWLSHFDALSRSGQLVWSN